MNTTTTKIQLYKKLASSKTPDLQEQIFSYLQTLPICPCIIGQPTSDSILSINTTTGDCIHLSISINSDSTATIIAKGFVSRILTFDINSLDQNLNSLNKEISLSIQAKRVAIPGLLASLNVLCLPNLIPATIQFIYEKQIPPSTRLEIENAKNGTSILTNAQHSERLYSLSISTRPISLSLSSSTAILDYARVSVSREKLKSVMQTARFNARIEEKDDDEDEEHYNGFNDDSEDDETDDDGPTTIIPLKCLLRDLIVLRSSTRERGKAISELIIQQISIYCLTIGWEIVETTPLEETMSTTVITNTDIITDIITDTITDIIPIKSKESTLLLNPIIPPSRVLSSSIPLSGNGWPISTNGFMSARTVATFQQAEKLALNAAQKSSSTTAILQTEETKLLTNPRKSWLSMQVKKPMSSSSTTTTETFVLSKILSQNWLSHRSESAANSHQLEVFCSLAIGSESILGTFEFSSSDYHPVQLPLQLSSSSSSSTTTSQFRFPKPLSIRFKTSEDKLREKEEQEGNDLKFGGPGIMDADLISNTTAAERNKLLASMNLNLDGSTTFIEKGVAGAEDNVPIKKKATKSTKTGEKNDQQLQQNRVLLKLQKLTMLKE